LKNILKNKVVSSVFILTVSGLIVKALGLLYKIPITSLLKDEGMGYFNSAYSVYSVFYTFSNAGLPVALSLMVSECAAGGKYKNCKRIFAVSTVFFTLLGLAGSLVMFFFSDGFSAYVGSSMSAMSMRAVAPSLVVICAVSALRGYFQGFQNMIPTAISQIFEALGKLLFGIAFALVALKQGKELYVASAYAIFGITLSSLLSLAVLLVFAVFERAKKKRASLEQQDCEGVFLILKKLLKIALPVTVCSSLLNIASSLDLVSVMRRLAQLGYSESTRNAMFGNYTALAYPVFNMPTVLIIPLTSALTPYISSALAKNDVEGARTACCYALKSSSVISMPCTVGMCLFSYPILALLFDDVSALRAAPLLSLLSLSFVFVALLSVTNSILQAHGRTVFPMISMATGIAAKFISSHFLIAKYEMRGAPISTLICYSLMCALNLCYILFKINCKVSFWKSFIMPLLTAFLAVIPVYCIYNAVLGETVSATFLFAAIAFSAVLYLVLCFVFGIIGEKEIEALFGCGKIKCLYLKTQNRFRLKIKKENK